jgi:ribose transport system substrate-binding protein
MIRSTRRLALHALAGAAALALLPQFALAADAKPRVALVMKSLANEFFQTMQDGAKADQKAHSSEYTLISNGIKDETDTAAQIKIVQQMLVEHVDAIVIAPADSKALVPVLAEAAAKGVIVVNIDNKLDADALKEKNLVVPFVGPDNRKGAKLAGDYLGKQLKAGDKVGILEGVSTTFNAQQRTAGFQDAMKAVGANVVSVQSGQWEMDKANAVAAAMLREHPDLRALPATTTWRSAPSPRSRARARQARCWSSATTTSPPSSRCWPTAACWRRWTSTAPSRPCSASTLR